MAGRRLPDDASRHAGCWPRCWPTRDPSRWKPAAGNALDAGGVADQGTELHVAAAVGAAVDLKAEGQAHELGPSDVATAGAGAGGPGVGRARCLVRELRLVDGHFLVRPDRVRGLGEGGRESGQPGRAVALPGRKRPRQGAGRSLLLLRRVHEHVADIGLPVRRRRGGLCGRGPGWGCLSGCPRPMHARRYAREFRCVRRSCGGRCVLQLDTALRDAVLGNLRYFMEDTPVDSAFGALLDARITEVFQTAKVKIRSSTNCEDLPNFSGAGLYTPTVRTPAVRTRDPRWSPRCSRR